MSDHGDIVLEAVGISKNFPGVRALDDVSLTLRSGRLTALLGENGAGKSTLMNIVAGVFPPDAGEVKLAGEVVSFANPREAHEAGITMIFQELNLVPNLSVAENIFLGREPLNRFGLIDANAMNLEAAALLERLDLAVEPTAPLGSLRVGQQQIVEIAKAISVDARVLIMDEPTSAITEHEIEVLFGIIENLKRQGVAIAYITHKLEELARIADDAVVMRDGRLIGASPIRELTHEAIVQMMVGREVKQRADESAEHPWRRSPSCRECLVEASRSPRRLSPPRHQPPGSPWRGDRDFRLDGGRADGAARNNLRTSSERLGGRDLRRWGTGLDPIASRRDRTWLRSRAGRSEERRAHVGHDCCRECQPPEPNSSGTLRIARPGSRAQPGWGVDRAFRVKTPSQKQIVRNLSGGNQQKVILGKWLATKPKVLLLDEPTRGIDVGAKGEIYALIEELTAAGLAVIVVSSELPEILSLSDRIVVLCEGRETATFDRAGANEESVMNAALPN